MFVFRDVPETLRCVSEPHARESLRSIKGQYISSPTFMNSNIHATFTWLSSFSLGMGHSLITTIGRNMSSTRLPHAAALATASMVAAVKQFR